jgi:hypothetical protein
MAKGVPKRSDEGDIPWHPAFNQAIQQELEQYKDILSYSFEVPLTAQPLKMDVLIIKKEKDVVIEKNIATIFRKENILEYKSPEDYVSVGDFYKVYGYACFYAALKTVAITDLTISFIGSRYPRELLKHLEEVRGYGVEEKWAGIYTVTGDIMPIQIINSTKLSVNENLWLRDLGDDVAGTDINKLALEIKRRGLGSQMGAYLYAVYRANLPRVKEAERMASTIAEFEEYLEEIGLTAKWAAEGEEKGRKEAIQNLLKFGMPPEQVSTALKVPLTKVVAVQEE